MNVGLIDGKEDSDGNDVYLVYNLCSVAIYRVKPSWVSDKSGMGKLLAKLEKDDKHEFEFEEEKHDIVAWVEKLNELAEKKGPPTDDDTFFINGKNYKFHRDAP